MTYNFPDHENGNTFNGVQFELLVNSVAKSIVGGSIAMTCITPVGAKVFSSDTGEIEIGSGASGGIFSFIKQVVTFTPVKSAYPPYTLESYTYPYEITITFADGDIKTYIEGTWKITE
jgi:hypothetical protein